VTPCRWPHGCEQAPFEDGLCSYHAKVAGGLITTTRGSKAADEVIPVPMTAAERVAADRRRREYEEARPPAPLVVRK
jgi:hypothetical protein